MKYPLPKLIPILFIFGVFVFLSPSFSKVLASSFVLNPPFGNVSAGKDLKVDIVLKGDGETIDGADAALTYESNFLRVRTIKEGAFFGLYPVKKSGEGKIRITALAPVGGVKIFGDIVVASLTFEVIDSGDTKINYDYIVGSTKESNVPLHGTAEDSLKEVKSGSYNIIATPEKVTIAKAKKAQGSPSLVPFFILLLILVGVGIWYYLHKRKPKEDVFIPEEFPLDRPPKLD